jgi:hypothetical protein
MSAFGRKRQLPMLNSCGSSALFRNRQNVTPTRAGIHADRSDALFEQLPIPFACGLEFADIHACISSPSIIGWQRRSERKRFDPMSTARLSAARSATAEIVRNQQTEKPGVWDQPLTEKKSLQDRSTNSAPARLVVRPGSGVEGRADVIICFAIPDLWLRSALNPVLWCNESQTSHDRHRHLSMITIILNPVSSCAGYTFRASHRNRNVVRRSGIKDPSPAYWRLQFIPYRIDN